MPAAYRTAPTLTAEQITRFWSKVAKAGPDECWLWTGIPRREKGYAEFRVGPRKIRAHVLARFLVTGEWPGELETCHSCDARYPSGDITYRRCINPAHLWLGTHAENMADMVAKGRNEENQVKGERHGSSKLTAAQVLEIRRLHATGSFTLTELGIRFGTTFTNIHNIVTRVSWRHLL